MIYLFNPFSFAFHVQATHIVGCFGEHEGYYETADGAGGGGIPYNNMLGDTASNLHMSFDDWDVQNSSLGFSARRVITEPMSLPFLLGQCDLYSIGFVGLI